MICSIKILIVLIEKYTIKINPTDTDKMEFGEYHYDIELRIGVNEDESLYVLDKEITEAKTIEKPMTSNFQTIVFASVSPLADLINANGFSVLSSAVKENLTLTNGTVFNVYKLENINVTGFKYTLKF